MCLLSNCIKKLTPAQCVCVCVCVCRPALHTSSISACMEMPCPGVFSVNDKQKFISQRIQICRQLSGESVNLDRNQRTRKIYILISLGAEEPCFI